MHKVEIKNVILLRAPSLSARWKSNKSLLISLLNEPFSAWISGLRPSSGILKGMQHFGN